MSASHRTGRNGTHKTIRLDDKVAKASLCHDLVLELFFAEMQGHHNLGKISTATSAKQSEPDFLAQCAAASGEKLEMAVTRRCNTVPVNPINPERSISQEERY